MVTYVLDSSAILRYLDDEAGAARVAEIIKSHLAGRCGAIVSALHWGEVAGITCKAHGKQAMELVLSRLSAFGLQIVAADGDRAVRASLIKVKRSLPYVDAFGVDLAGDSGDHVFVTADFDFKPAARDVAIEFLPVK
ncbi:MAG: PIN domain-containing protein [Candidatus Sulfotelmatobacter sp.]